MRVTETGSFQYLLEYLDYPDEGNQIIIWAIIYSGVVFFFLEKCFYTIGDLCLDLKESVIQIVI